VQASVDAGLRANAYVLEVYGAALGWPAEDAPHCVCSRARATPWRGRAVAADESVGALVAP
jgi:hypothetical protein